MYYLSSGVLLGFLTVSSLGYFGLAFSVKSDENLQPGVSMSAVSVNRAAKGDLIVSQTAQETRNANSPSAILDEAFRLFDMQLGLGGFGTAPLQGTDTSVFSKTMSMPAGPAQTQSGARVKPGTIETISKQPPPRPAEMPIGCEPAVSAAADHILARIASRCVS